ncbi:MAG: PAS domain S-box protein [Chthoniobacterales bacterium]
MKPVFLPPTSTSGETPDSLEMRFSELRYRRLFEAARDGILILDPDSRKIIDSNPYMTELLGYTRAELLGKELWQIGLLQDETASQATFRELQRDHYVRYANLPLRAKGGERREVEFVSNIYQEGDHQAVQCNIRDITERKKIDQRLTMLDSCVANLNDLVMITEAGPIHEPGPLIVFVNRAMERLTGYTADESLGRSPRFLHGKNTDGRVLKEIYQAFIQQKHIHRQILTHRKDGSEYWMDVNMAPIFDKAGKCTHFAAIARDITEEKKNAELLLWRTTFFEAQVHSSPDGILVTDNQQQKIIQNQRLTELWGIPPELVSEVDDSRQLAWATSQMRHPEHFGRIWTFRNITDRKRDEEKIAEQVAFMDKARDAIIARDLQGRILFWNKGAEHIYGWTAAEMIGRDKPSGHYADPTRLHLIWQTVLEQGAWSGEVKQLTKEGKPITVDSRWTLIRDNERQPKAVLTINIDITEKKKAEAQYLRAQRMESIGTLAGGIAHDLNNILAPIMMSIEVLKDLVTDPTARRILDTIEASSLRGASIVRQVLSFARGVEGERIPIQIKAVLGDLEAIVRDTFPKDIRLQTSIPQGIWPISGDSTQLYQVFLNLCVNARDAMPDGGHLTITVENCELDEHYARMSPPAQAGRYVKITIIDTGSGIPPDVIDKIFEPFFTTKDFSKGTGLGLSTVLGIVKSHLGILNVHSTPGRGTTFIIHLPAITTGDAATQSAAAMVAIPRGNGEIILLIDDEPSIITVTTQTLQTYGYRVISATNGAEAIAAYAQHRGDIALVLTDMMMPIMDGAATIYALQKINPSVLIIAASGQGSNIGTFRAGQAGIEHFLAKPYSAETMLRQIHQLLHPL